MTHPSRFLRTVASATLTTALLLAVTAGPAHANEPAGFGISISGVTGTGTAELAWHGSYSCSHDGAVLTMTAVNVLDGATVSLDAEELECPAYGAPIHGTIPAEIFPTWGQTARVTAAMTNLTHSAAVAAVTLTVSNDVDELTTVDDLIRSTDGRTLTYSGKFSCRVAGATAYLSIQATQLPNGHTATGTGYATLTCPSPAGTLGNWQATVTSILGPFQPGGVFRNVYVAHPSTLSGNDNEGCDDKDDYDDCDDE